MRPAIRNSLVVAVVLIGLAATLSFVLQRHFDANPDVQRFRSMVGKTESEVRQTLGTPHKVHDRASAPEHYYEEGYTFEKREITNKVFVYFAQPDIIAYLYFDQRDRVESVFVGAS